MVMNRGAWTGRYFYVGWITAAYSFPACQQIAAGQLGPDMGHCRLTLIPGQDEDVEHHYRPEYIMGDIHALTLCGTETDLMPEVKIVTWWAFIPGRKARCPFIGRQELGGEGSCCRCPQIEWVKILLTIMCTSIRQKGRQLCHRSGRWSPSLTEIPMAGVNAASGRTMRKKLVSDGYERFASAPQVQGNERLKQQAATNFVRQNKGVPQSDGFAQCAAVTSFNLLHNTFQLSL